MERRGETWSEEAEEIFRQPIRDLYEQEGSPYF